MPVLYEEGLHIYQTHEKSLASSNLLKKMVRRELCPCRVGAGLGITLFSKRPPPPLQLTEASAMSYAIQLPSQKIIWAPA